jgi:putative salt-induced outer membrane protein YdiY
MVMRSKSLDCCAGPGLVAVIFVGISLSGIGSAEADPTNRWESVAAFGGTLTRGNSESFLATASVSTARKWLHDEVLLGTSAGYGETTDINTDQTSKTTQFAKGYGQWNHLFPERLYAGPRVDALYDDVAGIDYRFTLSPLAGYYLVKDPAVSLALEVGPSFIAEELVDEEPRQYWGFRVGDRFEYKLPGKRARLWQTASWVPQFDNVNNWVLTFQAGVAATMTKSLELRLVADDQYDNEPAPGRRSNDFKLTAQLGYKF